MPVYTLGEISKIVKGQLKGEANIPIRHLLTDSRTLFSAADSLYFAIKGERHDGHKFINELYNKKGLKNFVVQHIDSDLTNIPDINFIEVPNTLAAMQMLAAAHRTTFHHPLIAITGSNGKTIVKEWLYQLMQSEKSIIRSPKSYNSQIGVPLSVWNLEPEADLAIIEAGISKHDEMKKLHPIIKPDIGIFTNIGEAHQENFFSLQRKTREKLILFRDTPVMIYCSDHDYIEEEIADWINKGQQMLTWSVKNEATLKIIKTEKSQNSTQITGHYNGRNIEISIPFTDYASFENAIHCWLLLLHLGFSDNFIATGMQKLTPVAMRLEHKKGINGCTIINDSYNSDIHSLRIALDFLNQQQQHTQKTVILSDILQSGKSDAQLCNDISRLLTEKKIDRFIGIGASLYANAAIFNGKKDFFQSTEEFIKHFHASDFQQEAILLKGARSFEFERISSLLEQKTHRTTLEINLSAMVHNLNYFRSKLKPQTKIAVMVKAFSYGSGSYEIANMLEYQKVDYLAVAFADEGVALRKEGITIPIMVMNPEENAFRQLIENALEPEIYSLIELRKFLEVLRNNQMAAYPIHIKLDTGMHRLGFVPEEIDELCKILEQNKNSIIVKSVFSHFAASDEAEHDAFTNQQAKRFEEMCAPILKISKTPIIKHLSNSLGIERFPEYQYDMVRLGIGLYGINPFKQELLLPVSTLKTSILQVKKIAPGETIGYSRKGMAENGKTIAIIPIGYADGYSRLLGNGNGNVWLKGCKVPIIGNICMDMSMINVTGIEANEGDEVEIFGEHITITELANKMQTIPYEVLTGIAQRVQRIYIQD